MREDAVVEDLTSQYLYLCTSKASNKASNVDAKMPSSKIFSVSICTFVLVNQVNCVLIKQVNRCAKKPSSKILALAKADAMIATCCTCMRQHASAYVSIRQRWTR